MISCITSLMYKQYSICNIMCIYILLCMDDVMRIYIYVYITISRISCVRICVVLCIYVIYGHSWSLNFIIISKKINGNLK